MGLQISLADREMLIVNGAVLRADGRLKLRVENQVTILRSRDIMTPEEATSPARRLYYSCMLAYLDEPNRQTHQEDVGTRFAEIVAALESPEAKGICVRLAQLLAVSDFYRALSECRDLIKYEGHVLTHGDPVSG
jgi:flagellar protein FlbT